MSTAWYIVRLCKNGHDKDVVGEYPGRRCKACAKARAAEWAARNPDKARANSRKTAAAARARQTLEQRRQSRRRQAGMKDPPDNIHVGRCANKGCAYTGPLVLDHDHDTGAIRGWLCRNCNLALGYAKDDTEALVGLIAYLRENRDDYAGCPASASESPAPE